MSTKDIKTTAEKNLSQRQEKALQAMSRRSQEKAKSKDIQYQYKIVVGGFCATMAAAGIYTLMNPATQFATLPIIDETAMLVHNGMSTAFTQSENDFFQNWTISDAKSLFEQGLSDTQNLEQCRSGKQDDIYVPEDYDFRKEHPACVKESVYQIDRDCASSYVYAAKSAVEDRICVKSGNQVKFSAQEILDCDKSSYGCKGGNSNRVLLWGKRKGFVTEDCYKPEKEGECPAEHLKTNQCRLDNEIYKVVDMCLAKGENDGIRKEIMTNGPVLSQLSPFTDFLTYSEGTYQRSQDSFKYNGSHIVKVIGWESQPDGGYAWILENTWGPTWGENGYARVLAQGDSSLDFFALGLASYPTNMKTYYEQQEEMAAQREMASSEQVFTIGGEGEVIDIDSMQGGLQADEEEVVKAEEL